MKDERKNMKLVFICHGIGNGGAERVFTTIANHISEMGHKVIIVTTNPSNNDYVLHNKIDHIEAYQESGNRISRVLNRLKTIRKVVKEIKPDCVISFSAVCNIQALLALTLIKKKIIISERTDPSRYPESKIYKILRWVLYPKADRIVFQTRMAKEYFGKKIQKKGIIIENPIRSNLPEPQIVRTEKIIIGVGSLCEQKNWFVALKACELFFKKNPDYIFEIYGEGEDRDALLEYIRERDILKSRVFLKGFCSTIEDKLKIAKIYISSSDYEGISNSMLEALALGTPVICTDCPVGGAKAMIDHKKNGILVPVGDYKSMSKALILLAQNDDICQKLSREAIRVREKYSENIIVDTWVNLINMVLSS